MAKVIIVIPARLNSKRLNRKVLLDINGKPMIERVYERALLASKIDSIYIAASSEEILLASGSFCNNTIKTAKGHKNGSDRIAEAAKKLDCDWIINVQADQPLIEPSLIDELANVLESSKEGVVSVMTKIKDDSLMRNPNCVKVSVDSNSYAKAFTRMPSSKTEYFYKHIGIYAYRKDFLLLEYPLLKESALGQKEKLEQLRILENGYAIQMMETTKDTKAVDCQKDLDDVCRRYKSSLLST